MCRYGLDVGEIKFGQARPGLATGTHRSSQKRSGRHKTHSERPGQTHTSQAPSRQAKHLRPAERARGPPQSEPTRLGSSETLGQKLVSEAETLCGFRLTGGEQGPTDDLCPTLPSQNARHRRLAHSTPVLILARVLLA